MTRRHPYDEATDRELARWPGVTVEREYRGVHLGLVVTFGRRSRTVIFAASPSDGARGLQNHLGVLRRVLAAMGARRPRLVRQEARSRAKRPPTEPRRIAWPDPPVCDPTRDPWVVLRTLLP